MVISLVIVRIGSAVLPNPRMCDVDPALALQTLRCVASSVEGKSLCAPAQESNASPIPDAHKQVEVQDERVRTGEHAITPPVLIPEFDFVRGAADDLAQFSTIKQHVGDTSGIDSPDDPRVRGETQNAASVWILELCAEIVQSRLRPICAVSP
jgi:hypothetical protein